MSQKTNPISLRLQKSNKHFESSWYSDLFYDQVLGDELRLRVYIEGLFFQAGRSKALPSIQSQYKRHSTLLFFMDQRAELHKREFSLKLSREPIEHTLSPKLKFLCSKRKNYLTALDELHLNKVKKILSMEGSLQKKGYKYLLEEGVKQRILVPFRDNSTEEYVYNYAVKGFSLESNSAELGRTRQNSAELGIAELPSCRVAKLLLLSKAEQYRFSAKLSKSELPRYSLDEASSATFQIKRVTPLQNSSLHRGLNYSLGVPKSTINKASIDSFTKSKVSLGFSGISFILSKGFSYKEEVTFKTSALVLSQVQSHSGLYMVGKKTNNDSDRLLAEVEPKRNKKINPSQGVACENLFRRLILDCHSQSTQNRLPFTLVRGLDKLRACPNTPSIGGKDLLKRLGPSSAVDLLKSTDTRDSNTACLVPHNWRTKSKSLVHYSELFLNLFSGKFRYHTVCPVRAISPFQATGFLIESVAYLLQRKCTFRQIKDEIFRELERSQLVKGARLSCAGRLGGRSKKAQKAKTQSAQWGETSLTVFSSRLAFSSKGVNTTYGKVGVKLWLCYK